jgi:CRISPR-associated endoribonuclease Cas6
VIEPPFERTRVYRPGEELVFGLLLIGRATDYLPYFIYTFDELGRTGLGKGREKFGLQSVDLDAETIYDAGSKTLRQFKTARVPLDGTPGRGRKKGTLTLSFLTPTRIVYNSDLTLDLEFHMLVRNLLRRISLLSYFHGNGRLAAFDFKGLIEKAKEVKVIGRDLRWWDWERYSGRQERRINMGGFVGDVTFEGDLRPFIQILKAGEILHVGKGTAFGLGRYGVE